MAQQVLAGAGAQLGHGSGCLAARARAGACVRCRFSPGLARSLVAAAGVWLREPEPAHALVPGAVAVRGRS